MEALKKMSAKSILGNVKRFVPMDDKRDVIDGAKVQLFRVFGLARGIKKGQSDNGDWLAFLGDFRAQRLDAETGEVVTFGSNTLFLPACAEMMLAPVVAENDGSGVEFSFDIGLVGRPASSVGYEFTADSVLAVRESEAILDLAAKLPPPKWATKQLAAPVAETAQVEQADKAPAKGKSKAAEAATA
jgi:hypothetical protein